MAVGRVLGVDACPGGWVGILLDHHRAIAPTLAELVGPADIDLRVIAIDVPIGLPDTGVRQADLLVRYALGVGACRFVGDVMLGLLGGRSTERTSLEMVRSKRFRSRPNRSPRSASTSSAGRWTAPTTGRIDATCCSRNRTRSSWGSTHDGPVAFRGAFTAREAPPIDIGHGDVVRLTAGKHTVWTVTETSRTIYLTPERRPQ